MTSPAQSPQSVATRSSAIDPARAWILGIVVEDDGGLRAAPAAGNVEVTAQTAGERGQRASVCTCPDYCDVEHDLV